MMKRFFLFGVLCLGMWLHSDAAYAAGCTDGCPEGSSCQVVMVDNNTGLEMCVPDEIDPVPELSVMMIPVALGAAGFFAYRARRNASK